MQSLSTKISTTSLFQVVDVKLMEELILYLEGCEENNFVKGAARVDLQEQLVIQYPEIMDIIFGLAAENGFIADPIAQFIIYKFDHTLEVYDNSEKRKPSVMKRWIHKYLCCEKGFPKHKALTSRLFIMTCACPQKFIYGLAQKTMT